MFVITFTYTALYLPFVVCNGLPILSSGITQVTHQLVRPKELQTYKYQV